MKIFIILAVSILITGCGFNSIKKTTHLEPGMSTSQVRQVMGDPDSSEFSNGYMVWKYSLQKPWVGFIPHYLAFDEGKKLIAWKANMKEYYASQNLWLQSLPKQHDVTIKGDVKHKVRGTIDVR